ncbi:MAG: sigma 54-interacting transcriptional regulator [Bacillota bacterium]
MQVKQLMRRDFIVLAPSVPLSYAIRVLSGAELPVALVIDERGALAGIIDCACLLKGMAAGVSEIPVEKVMCQQWLWLQENASLDELPWDQMAGACYPVRDGGGALVGVVYSFDLTRGLYEHHQASTKELDAIIDSFYDGIYISNQDAVTVKVNSAYERITGIKPGEVVGQRLQDLLDQGLFTHSSTLLVLETGQPVTVVSRIKRTGKEVIVSGSPVFNDQGQLVKVVNSVRDITELNRLKQQLEQEKELQQRFTSELKELRARQLDMDVVVHSEEMLQVVDLAVRVAEVDSTVLILGESGVGKEVIAKIIHAKSPRVNGPFIKINCGAIPENLLESELFGYEGGAFTGARKQGKPGLFELAHGGTILLDEIADLSPSLQVKLLRVLQEQELLRVGGTHPVKVNVRILAATNKNLRQMVKLERFREDLYYRLNVVPIEIPPLRQRRDDILPLIVHFAAKFNQKYKTNRYLSPEVIDRLLSYQWPGNVRELENMVERLIVTSRGHVVNQDMLPESLQGEDAANYASGGLTLGPLKRTLQEVEKQLIDRALRQCRSTRKAARVLGINQSTVVRKARQYCLATGEGVFHK